MFNGVKVFSATMVLQRESLGEVVSKWIATKLAARPKCTAVCDHDPCSCGSLDSFEVVDIVVSQSSDDRFHCVAIIVFYNEAISRKAA